MKSKTKRHYHHSSEDHLYKRLKITVLAIILIPLFSVILFSLFGPKIGSIFGLISVNRKNTGNSDNIAPPLPIFDNAPQATSSSPIAINGFAEPGTTVKLFVNGPELQTSVVSSDGTFRFEGINLINGINTIFAKAVDAGNNESEKSINLSIAYDTEKAKITINEPKNNTTVKNLNNRVFIKGKISEKVTLKINDKFAILKPDLSFEFPLGVKEGWNEIKIVAEDLAGNTSEETIKVNYVREN